MKNILLLGGCGYIGSALFQQLSSKYNVDTVDLEWFGNYSNPKNIKKNFADLDQEFLDNYDVVVLLAANSSVPLCNDIFDAFENNVVNFLRLVKKLKKQKFIYASSSAVYTSLSEIPKTEETVLDPQDSMTLTKTTMDKFMSMVDVEYYGLRFGSVNGWSPNMRTDLMINSMVTTSLKSKQVVVTNGHAYRPILSINDLCNAIEKIIESNEDKRGVYNLASFNENILEIGQRIAKFMNVELVDKGNNYTYNFKIDSKKFTDAYSFEFKDTIESIANSITSKEYNPNWQRRENK